MKRLFPLLLIFLLGCGREDPAMRRTLELRSRLLGAGEISFRAGITAHYIDTLEVFTLDCRVDAEGTVSFTAVEPLEIAGIAGTVSGQQGALRFDETVLAFPLTDGRISPVSTPWILMRALREGYVVCAAQEGETLHMTIDDSYGDDALTVDIWEEDGMLIAAEISRDGRRVMVLQIEGFTLV